MLNCDLAATERKGRFFSCGELLCKVGVFESNKLVYITNGNLAELEIFIEINLRFLVIIFKKYAIAEFSFNFCRVRTLKNDIERDALTPAQHVSEFSITVEQRHVNLHVGASIY